MIEFFDRQHFFAAIAQQMIAGKQVVCVGRGPWFHFVAAIAHGWLQVHLAVRQLDGPCVEVQALDGGRILFLDLNFPRKSYFYLDNFLEDDEWDLVVMLSKLPDSPQYDLLASSLLVGQPALWDLSQFEEAL